MLAHFRVPKPSRPSVPLNVYPALVDAFVRQDTVMIFYISRESRIA